MDTQEMAGDATDYEIQTQMDIVDILINALTSGIISSRKVTVKK